jgi:hypothetical protein
MRDAMRRTREERLDDDPITLAEASKLLLRGIVTVSALRAEIKRGNLVAEKIGKNLFTMPAAIRALREKCRVTPGLGDVKAQVMRSGGRNGGLERRCGDAEKIESPLHLLPQRTFFY